MPYERLYADIHIHALCGVDDGAVDEETMHRMVDAAYADGTRVICFTPHWNPTLFRSDCEAIGRAYEQAVAYVSAQGYDLRLALGNELRYADTCVEWLREGFCKTLNGTRNVLVDFDEHEERQVILKALGRLLNAGYKPILAHVERYPAVQDIQDLHTLRSDGVRFQLDSMSITGGFGLGCKRRARRYLKAGLADMVASDAHDVTRRGVTLSEAYTWVSDHISSGYAHSLFWKAPLWALGISPGDTASAPKAGSGAGEDEKNVIREEEGT